jgi:uncharacterized protein involved in exopolysaccharide biosynthesis
MLQTVSSPQQTFIGARGPEGLERYFAIAKRRPFYFLIPFVICLALGSLLVAIQRPIYQAQGKILVETQDIPATLVQPTITDTANQRIQVIQQRITTRDNLLQIVQKYKLFSDQRQWMSASQLLDLMKARTELKLVDLTLPTQQNSLTIAFTLSFEYENPELAARVANEFLTLVLAEDVRNRTNRAAETTKFVEQEVKRQQELVNAIEAKITETMLKPQDPQDPQDSLEESDEQLKEQREELTKLKFALVQVSAVHSSAHPDVIALKKKIAALEKLTEQESGKPKQKSGKSKAVVQSDSGLDALKQRLRAADTNLEEANRKLTAARLGESLERNQQSERLQVLEQPVVPQSPIKPNRPKLLAIALAVSLMAGFGTVMAAESLDKSIHSRQELANVVDSRLIVTIPYIATTTERLRRRRQIALLIGVLALFALAAIVFTWYHGLSFDLSRWVQQSWIDQLTRLSK